MVFSAVFDIESLNGKNGFVISDSQMIPTWAGDVNADGLKDMILGSGYRSDDDKTGGSINILYGNLKFNQTVIPSSSSIYGFAVEFSPLPSEMNDDQCSNCNPSIDDYNAYGSVIGVGDINGDKIEDLVAYQDETNGVKESSNSFASSVSYALYGKQEEFPQTIYLDMLNGTGGFVYNQNLNWRFGNTCSSYKLGDVNGDDIGDIMIECLPCPHPIYNNDIPIMVAYGSLSSNSTNFNNGVTLGFGYNGFSGIGDINGDGIDDFMISGYDQLYVVFGCRNFNSSFDESTLNGKNGFTINTTINFNIASDLGDVNADGINYFMLGNYYCNNTYIIFGNQNGFSQYFDINSLNGQNGFVISASGAIDWLGDINNDGINDIIVATNVIYGSKYEFRSPFNVSNLNGQNGFRIFNAEGASVSGLGDVNGDKIDDFAIDNYVIFGQGSALFEENV
jgi:hypothetical protein